MEFLGKVRLKIGNSVLRKKISRTSRKKYYTGISNVKSIGMIWDASIPEDFVQISRFHQKMSERNIDVSVLAYYPGKELPDQLTAIRYLSCIRKKDISAFYLPLSAEADTFIGKKFDVLIDINFNKLFPLYYLTALSESKFKVGLYQDNGENGNCDLMLEIKKPIKLESYLSEVVNYLEMIKS